MKNIIKSIAILLLIALTVGVLCSCGLLPSPDTNTNTGKVTKIDLATAAENYEKLDVKKSSITVKVKGTVYIREDAQQKSQQPLNESYNIGSTLFLTRTQENDKLFLTSKVIVTDTDEQAGGLLRGIIETFDPADLHIDRQENESFYTQAMKYLRYAHHYLSKEVDLSAELGVQNDIYNLKAHFEDRDKEAQMNEDIWLVADKKSLADWLDNKAKLEVTENRLNSYLMKTIFSQLDPKSIFFDKDNANKYEDKNGNSSYDISVKADEIIASVLSNGLLDLLGVSDKTGAVDTYADYFSDVKNWFKVTVNNVNAGVNNKKLPKNATTGFNVKLDIDSQKVRDIIKQMERDEVIDSTTSIISTIVLNWIDAYFCGTDGNDNNIGISMDVAIEEKFFYGQTECTLSDDDHKDFFIGIDQDVPGRDDLSYYVLGIIINIDKYVSKFVEALGDKYKDNTEAIRDEIMQEAQRLKESEGEIRIDDLRPIIRSVLLKYTPDETEEDETEEPVEGGSSKTTKSEKVEQIMSEIFSVIGG